MYKYIVTENTIKIGSISGNKAKTWLLNLYSWLLWACLKSPFRFYQHLSNSSNDSNISFVLRHRHIGNYSNKTFWCPKPVSQNYSTHHDFWSIYYYSNKSIFKYFLHVIQCPWQISQSRSLCFLYGFYRRTLEFLSRLYGRQFSPNIKISSWRLWA